MEYPVKYPKIQTLFMRDPKRKIKRKGLILRNMMSRPEFSNILRWNVSEKLHGENTRVHIHYYKDNFQDGDGKHKFKAWFGGRGDNAKIHPDILNELKHAFNPKNPKPINDVFWIDNIPPTNIMLFGEAIGEGIHHGGAYYDIPTFVLFDVIVDGWWLERKNVEDIAIKLGFLFAPSFGKMIVPEIIEFVKSKPNSLITQNHKIIEGVVCRPTPEVLFRNGNPVIFKLKCKDFDDIETYEKSHGDK